MSNLDHKAREITKAIDWLLGGWTFYYMGDQARL